MQIQKLEIKNNNCLFIPIDGIGGSTKVHSRFYRIDRLLLRLMVGTDDDLGNEPQEDEHNPHGDKEKGDQDHGADPDPSPNDLPKKYEKTRQNSQA